MNHGAHIGIGVHGIAIFQFGSFFRYDNMTDSEIEDSPLVSDTEAWVAGIGLGYVLFEE